MVGWRYLDGSGSGLEWPVGQCGRQSALEQDTEPLRAPMRRLVPCMVSSAITMHRDVTQCELIDLL